MDTCQERRDGLHEHLLWLLGHLLLLLECGHRSCHNLAVVPERLDVFPDSGGLLDYRNSGMHGQNEVGVLRAFYILQYAPTKAF